MNSSVSSHSTAAASLCSTEAADSELTAEDVCTVKKGRLILEEEDSNSCCQVGVGCIVPASEIILIDTNCEVS